MTTDRLYEPTGHPGIETPGGRDFLSDIRHDLEEVVHPHDRDLPEDIAEGLEYELPTVAVRNKRPSRGMPSVFVSGDTNAHELLGPDTTRYRATIKAHASNAAGSTVTLSYYSSAGGQSGYPLFPGESVVIENTGPVYWTASAVGLGIAVYAERFGTD